MWIQKIRFNLRKTNKQKKTHTHKKNPTKPNKHSSPPQNETHLTLSCRWFSLWCSHLQPSTFTENHHPIFTLVMVHSLPSIETLVAFPGQLTLLSQPGQQLVVYQQPQPSLPDLLLPRRAAALARWCLHPPLSLWTTPPARQESAGVHTMHKMGAALCFPMQASAWPHPSAVCAL